jgi:hypothetical protein
MVNETLPVDLIGCDRFYAHNGIMNQIIDASLFVCGYDYYTQDTLVNLLSDAYTLSADLATAIDDYLYTLGGE